MATLTFKQKGKESVAEVVVSAGYNLHIEREKGGTFEMWQRHSSSGKYARCMLPNVLNRPDEIIDWSFGHGLYPMYIRLVSSSPVTSAIVTEKSTL